jgi:hypothetical protein
MFDAVCALGIDELGLELDGLALEPLAPLLAAVIALGIEPLLAAGVVALGATDAGPPAAVLAGIPSASAGFAPLEHALRSKTNGPSATPAPSALLWRMKRRRVSL